MSHCDGVQRYYFSTDTFLEALRRIIIMMIMHEAVPAMTASITCVFAFAHACKPEAAINCNTIARWIGSFRGVELTGRRMLAVRRVLSLNPVG